VIEYDNYEGTFELCRYCVVPYKPLEVDDTVEVSYNKKFYPGTIHAVHGDSLDFIFDDTPDKVFSDIPLHLCRRPITRIDDPSQLEYELGEPVFALWHTDKDDDGESSSSSPSQQKYYAAMIVAIEYPNRDMYTLLYSDNDEISGVHASDLLPMTYSVVE
jgi:hypothetical protein